MSFVIASEVDESINTPVTRIDSMNKIICQKEEVCAGCECELPKGSWAYENQFGDLFCEECEEIEKD